MGKSDHLVFIIGTKKKNLTGHKLKSSLSRNRFIKLNIGVHWEAIQPLKMIM